MKKFLFIPLLFLSPLSRALDVQVIGPFSGLNNTDNSTTIPNEKAQDLLNVDLSLGGRSIKKREGYGLAYALTTATSPVHGVYDFYDSNGNDVAISFNEYRMTSVINGGSATVLMTTGTLNATYQCVDSQGYAYCANTSRDRLIRTDGVNFINQTVVTTGSIVALTPDRLVMSGLGSTAPNRVDFSAAGDFTSWTTGIDATSAFQFTITAPGSKITCLAYAFNRIMWWKDSSFGYILPGATAADWVVKTISPNVGSLDNTYVYYKDILYFRGQDGHIWSYDGSSLVKLTRDIGGTISVSQTRASASITQTSQSDWGAGTYDNPVYVDTETTSGIIQTTFPDYFTSFRNGTSNTKKVWSAFCTNSCSSNTSVSSGNLVMTTTNGTGGQTQWVRTSSGTENYQQGTTYYVLVSSISNDGISGHSAFIVSFSSIATLSSSPAGSINNYFYFQFVSSKSNSVELSLITNSQDLDLCGGSSAACPTTTLTVPAAIQIYLSTSNYALTVNGTAIKDGTHTYLKNKQFIYLGYFGAISGNGSAYVDSFGMAPTTFTYTSPILSIGSSISSWDSLNISQSFGDGTITYQFGSTNSASISAVTNYQSIVSGGIPTVSTNPYAAVKAKFSTDEWDDSPQLSDYTINWFEGNASDKSYATAFKDDIWWSVTSGTSGVTTNNTILKYDLLNNAWLKYDIASNGFYIRNNSLYFGHSTSGNVFKFGDTNSDYGSSINSYWKSKDFFGDPFTTDDITDASFFFKAVNNSSMTATFTVGGSSSTTKTIPCQRSGVSFGNYNLALPQGTSGNTFNIQVGNDAAEQPWEVFAEEFRFNVKPWKPGSQ